MIYFILFVLCFFFGWLFVFLFDSSLLLFLFVFFFFESSLCFFFVVFSYYLIVDSFGWLFSSYSLFLSIVVFGEWITSLFDCSPPYITCSVWIDRSTYFVYLLLFCFRKVLSIKNTKISKVVYFTFIQD